MLYSTFPKSLTIVSQDPVNLPVKQVSLIQSGTYHIDASELSRVFPLNTEETSRRNTTAPGAEVSAVLEVKVAMLESQLERERETVDDLRRRLDRSEDRVYALTHQTREGHKPTSFLRRLFG